MRSSILAGVTGAVVIASAMAGCSSTGSDTGSSSSPTTGGVGGGAPALLIDGENRDVSGEVSCTDAGDNINIGIGEATDGVGAVVSDTSPPAVHSVGLGKVDDVVLGYSDAATNQGGVQATRDGKSYRITGTATGVDTSQQRVTKSFEMSLTCP